MIAKVRDALSSSHPLLFKAKAPLYARRERCLTLSRGVASSVAYALRLEMIGISMTA